MQDKSDALKFLGTKVRMARIENAVTIDRLTGGAGISKSTLNNIERGRRDCTLINALRVLQAAGYDHEEIGSIMAGVSMELALEDCLGQHVTADSNETQQEVMRDAI